MSVRARLRPSLPLLGILLVAAGWALSHQVGSDGVFDDCAHPGTALVVVVSVLGLLVTAAGGIVCIGLWRGSTQGEGARFLAGTGALLALFAGFAILLQLAAGLILPECAA